MYFKGYFNFCFIRKLWNNSMSLQLSNYIVIWSMQLNKYKKRTIFVYSFAFLLKYTDNLLCSYLAYQILVWKSVLLINPFIYFFRINGTLEKKVCRAYLPSFATFIFSYWISFTVCATFIFIFFNNIKEFSNEIFKGKIVTICVWFLENKD